MPNKTGYFFINIKKIKYLKLTPNCFNIISASKRRIRVAVITDSIITTRRFLQLEILYLKLMDMTVKFLYF